MPEPDGSTYVQSLARGLAVIRAFSAERPRMSLSEIARATELTRASARRFLLTLEAEGYVRSDGREFALTPRVLELGFSYLSSQSLPEVAMPHLETLSRAVGESASASVLDGVDIVYVARVPTRRIMSVAITVGTRFPAVATSMGRVLLAGMPDDDLDTLLAGVEPRRYTEKTLVDARDLRAEIARVREQGWSLVDGELEPGLRSLAVPVRRGRLTVAAINVALSGVGDAATGDLGRLLPHLDAAAASISADLALTASTPR